MISMEEGVDLDENRLAESNAGHEPTWSRWKTPKVEPRSENLIGSNGQANTNNSHLDTHAIDYQNDPLDGRQGSNELDTLPGTNDENNIANDEMSSTQNEEAASDFDDMGYDPLAEIDPAPPSNSDDHGPLHTNDDNQLMHQPDDEDDDDDDEEEDQKLAITDPDIWTLPANKDICTLEEIRRGQSINKTAYNECPVPGCGKKINESRAEPSPGTISSGLRTHVLFVHYANRKPNKKRKLGWSTKRRSQPSPKKQVGQMPAHSSASTSMRHALDYDMMQLGASDLTSSSNLLHRGVSPTTISPKISGPTLGKKLKQASRPSQTFQMSSLQSLMQATGSRLSPQPKQKNNDTNAAQKIFNPTTSSLFTILAGLTQQQQNANQQQGATNARNIKPVQGTNTINVSQCSKNPTTTNNNINNNNNRPANSSLLSLLNEKISGNVASSLQNQLKKTLGADLLTKHPTSAATRQSAQPQANLSLFPYNNNNNNNGQDLSYTNANSILSSLCSGNSDNRLSYDNSMSLNTFVESIAIKTGSNIGPAGIAEAKKIIEKFTTSLICSSQTIADHYLAPYGGDVAQQKPEIGPSDMVLAYKMMHKSHGQP